MRSICDFFSSSTQKLSLNTVCCIIQMLGPCDTVQPVFDGMKVSDLPRDSDVTRLLVNVCGEATLVLFQHVEAATFPNAGLEAIGKNLWENLALHLNDSDDVDLVLLALRNLGLLVDVIEKVYTKS